LGFRGYPIEKREEQGRFGGVQAALPSGAVYPAQRERERERERERVASQSKRHEPRLESNAARRTGFVTLDFADILKVISQDD
jgi:hypothetical protein